MKIRISIANNRKRSLLIWMSAVSLSIPALMFSQESKNTHLAASRVLVSSEVAGVHPSKTVADKRLDTRESQIAAVDGQPIYESDLPASVQGQLLALRNQEYDAKRKALDTVIEQKLLDVAAKKQGVSTEELLKREVDSKISEPTAGEVEAFYLAVKDRVNKPFKEMESQLRDALKQVKTNQARQEYVKRLRGETNVAVLLSPPRVEVAHDPARVRGNAKPQVMIVEFSDYQCPYCHTAESTIRNVLAKYGDKVSLSYRDFPLTAIHANAENAALASRCAAEQGKFWEYHDELFKASNLEKEALVGYARELKLDETKFSSCLSSEKYKAEIENDIQDGRKAGVSGTPSFFINGAATSGNQQETLMRMIDEELGRKR
jgi:protein-disulfide isomerase